MPQTPLLPCPVFGAKAGVYHHNSPSFEATPRNEGALLVIQSFQRCKPNNPSCAALIMNAAKSNPAAKPICRQIGTHALPSRPVGYLFPVLTADGKLDCAPK